MAKTVDVLTSSYQETDGSFTINALIVGLASADQVEKMKQWLRDNVKAQVGEQVSEIDANEAKIT